MGVGDMSSITQIQERLVARKKAFEIEKNRAVGRGRPFMKALGEAGRLTDFTKTMAKQLGLISADLRLSSEGEAYLKVGAKNRNAILIVRMLQTYKRYQQFLRTLAGQQARELHVPIEKGPSTTFERNIGIPGLSRIYFETILDLSTQLGLVNWHVETSKPKPRTWVVYLACSIRIHNADRAQDTSSSSTIVFDIGNEAWSIEFNLPDYEHFSQNVWQNYLELAKYVPLKPIIYSTLRSRVCYSLRISDSVFDRYADRLMSGDEKFLLVGAGGTLPFSRDSASLLKSLPPKTDRGEYKVYLKMDRKN